MDANLDSFGLEPLPDIELTGQTITVVDDWPHVVTVVEERPTQIEVNQLSEQLAR